MSYVKFASLFLLNFTKKNTFFSECSKRFEKFVRYSRAIFKTMLTVKANLKINGL